MGTLGLIAGASSPPLARTAAALGPPAICFPIEIASARSLPFGKGAFEAERGYELGQVVPDALAILAESEDGLVHMETIRRAAIYLTREATGGQARSDALRDARCHALLSRLRARVIALELEREEQAPASRRARALASFDLGYAQAALMQCGWREDGSGVKEIERAIALDPDDGVLRLGAALASFDTRGSATWEHLAAAFERAGDAHSALGTNLLGTAGRILGVSTHEELGERIRRRRA